MPRRQWFAFLLILLCFSTALVQCGTYAECVRYYNAHYNKQGTCPGKSASDYEKQAKECESRLEQCTDEDRAKARETTECIEQLEVCTNALSHGGKLLSCYTRLQGLSSACVVAFSRP